MLTVASSKKYRLKIKYEQRRDFRTIKRYHKTLHHCEEGFENFTENTDFISEYQLANLVDIILDVEDHFKIHIDNESMEKW
jgi:ribosomal protein S15P/S13E